VLVFEHFTARRWPSIRPSVCPSVCPSIRPSVCPSVCPSVHHVGGLYPDGYTFNDVEWPRTRISTSRQFSILNISETTLDKAIVTIEHQYEVACAVLNSDISNDLQWPIRSRYFFWRLKSLNPSRGLSVIAEFLVLSDLITAEQLQC